MKYKCNKEIKNFIENKFVNRKLERGGWSVPRAPVMHPCVNKLVPKITDGPWYPSW